MSDPDVAGWFFGSWTGPVRVATVGILAYVGLVTLLRVSGKRTLSKMNAFDLVVTVALGSTLAATLLNNSVSLAQGTTAFFVLIGVQYAVAWTCARSDRADRLFKSSPTIILWRGKILDDVIRAERISREEVVSAIRGTGLASISHVEVAVLETTGDISVIKTDTDTRVPDSIDALHSAAGTRLDALPTPGPGR
jgi:uncharacterized membrane protein YcaP (DUF421 family)